MPTVGVGIGTTVPSVPLQIGTTSNNIYANYSVTGAGSIIYSSYATIPNVSGSTSYSGNLTVFSTAAYGRNSGGSIALGGLMYNFGAGNYMNSLARISGVQSNTTDTYDGDLVLESVNNGTMYERMRIKTNGYVGIGTTLPNATLHVNGGLKTGQIYSFSASIASLATSTNTTTNLIPQGSIGVYLVTVTGLDTTFYRKLTGTAIVSTYYDGGSYYTANITQVSSFYVTFVSISNAGVITFNQSTGGTASISITALCIG